MQNSKNGSARQIDENTWECIIQSKYTNPDSKTLSPKRIKRRGKTESEARKKAKQALLVWEKNFEKTQKNINIETNKPFGYYMEKFIEDDVKQNVTGSTYKSYIYTMNANFYKYKISKLPIKSLNKVEFEVFYDTLIKEKSESTAAVPIQLCKRCCEWLTSQTLLEENYASQAKYKKQIRDEFFRKDEEEKKIRKEIFSIEDIQKFYNAYKNNMSQYCSAIILILETMMRGQELLALTLDDIDFTQNTITIKSAISERFVDNDKTKGLEKYIKIPKNGKERIVYMTPLAREVVEYMIAQTKIKCRSNPYNLLFPSYQKHGKFRTMDAFEIQFKDICNKLGIDRDVHVTRNNHMIGLNVHALRHTAITIANTAPGANVINTALMAGHTSIRTENIYTHTNIDALKNIKTASNIILNNNENNTNDDNEKIEKLQNLLNKNGIKLDDLISFMEKEK